MLKFSWLIPLLPLFGFIINALFNKKISKPLSAFIANGTILGAFIITLTIFINFVNGNAEPITVTFFDFISTGSIDISFSILIDQLSVLMMMVITGVGFLIHLYSIGYMKHDEGFQRYFSYLNLFVFFMLLLVLGSNYLIMFIGWEGVGLASYLLIGFWFDKEANNQAAKKAFVVNRIGDLGFLAGLFFLLQHFGTLEFTGIFNQASGMQVDHNGTGIITLITLLLFIGATGKSAQIPLYTWLPDAMAGPTPVSSLIHAATMVTAGIYMIIRSNILYILSPVTLTLIGIIGVLTAIFAAIIGLAQNDIKKVLAYSTISQLGYMFLALGVGAFTAGFFHLVTHAFFKGLLFLAAGSVIHAMSDDQDMRNMGRLRKHLPITFYTFLIATLAITGIPPFSGFFSKDLILAEAFKVSPVLWGLGVAGAFLTAFYMFRALFLTFYGNFRGTETQKHHLHESPAVMTIPLIILALLSLAGGLINIPALFHGNEALAGFMAPLFESSNKFLKEDALHLSHSTEYILMGISVGGVLLSILAAWSIYIRKQSIPAAENKELQLSALHRIVYHKFYIDELYNVLFVNSANWFSRQFHNILDRGIIDGIVNLLGWITLRLGSVFRRLQTGDIGFYIFAMVIGMLIIVALNTII